MKKWLLAPNVQAFVAAHDTLTVCAQLLSRAHQVVRGALDCQPTAYPVLQIGLQL